MAGAGAAPNGAAGAWSGAEGGGTALAPESCASWEGCSSGIITRVKPLVEAGGATALGRGAPPGSGEAAGGAPAGDEAPPAGAGGPDAAASTKCTFSRVTKLGRTRAPCSSKAGPVPRPKAGLRTIRSQSATCVSMSRVTSTDAFLSWTRVTPALAPADSEATMAFSISRYADAAALLLYMMTRFARRSTARLSCGLARCTTSQRGVSEAKRPKNPL
mmetsp:Transcript_9189/g.35936  ORF Transcript_9189/g.35936 Transcript_9189/m.35936 type:complete len:217 (+) Transcript_9189:628-1278(+)